MKYIEIFKLKEMLEAKNIPFSFNRSLTTQIDFLYGLGKRYQICYPVDKLSERICSVIEGYGTYGGDLDKLEIMGLLTEEENKYDTVVGGLTAEEVFKRIENHWKKSRRKSTNV